MTNPPQPAEPNPAPAAISPDWTAAEVKTILRELEAIGLVWFPDGRSVDGVGDYVRRRILLTPHAREALRSLPEDDEGAA